MFAPFNLAMVSVSSRNVGDISSGKAFKDPEAAESIYGTLRVSVYHIIHTVVMFIPVPLPVV